MESGQDCRRAFQAQRVADDPRIVKESRGDRRKRGSAHVLDYRYIPLIELIYVDFEHVAAVRKGLDLMIERVHDVDRSCEVLEVVFRLSRPKLRDQAVLRLPREFL